MAERTERKRPEAERDERISPATLKAGEPGTKERAGAAASRKGSGKLAAGIAAGVLVVCLGVGAHALMGAPSAPDTASQDPAAAASAPAESGARADAAASSSSAAQDADGKAASAKTAAKKGKSAKKKAGKAAAKSSASTESAGGKKQGGSASSSKSSKRKSASKKGQSSSSKEEASGKSDGNEAADGKISVHVSIDSSAAASQGYPSSMADTWVTLDEGATVFDALLACKVSYRGNSTYVSAIGGLAEKQVGGGSGWMYSVNDEVPMKACGKYRLSPQDKVRWYYVTGPLDEDKM